MMWLGVFIAVSVADALWTGWMRAVDARDPALASLFSVSLVLTSAYVTVAYVENRKLLIPAALGAFVGTYLSVYLG